MDLIFFVTSLSEVCSSSDTSSAFCCYLVRRFLVFGYKFGYSLLRCLKFASLRTQTSFFVGSLSEGCSSSDTPSPFRWFVVRSLLVFGQNHGKSLHPSPKFARLRTHRRHFVVTLSEDCSSSDTNLAIRCFVV